MDYNFIKEKVFEEVGFTKEIDVEFYEAEGLSVIAKAGKYSVGAKENASFARGCFLLAMNLSDGKEEFEINETPKFSSLGVMLDCSRYGVMKVEAVKKYINCLAALGFNVLMLYTEDTFEVENRPRFGYMRGRYTVAELQEIVAYGKKMGVELIPHIQTLGHMLQYIKWSRPGAPDYTNEHIWELTDTESVLLCESEETYRFIEDMISACRKAFNSKRIHIGMDEAHDLGLGQYRSLHGNRERFEIMIKHLDKVCEICKKYDFEPMLYGDMFIKLAREKGYFDKGGNSIPDSLKKAIPECQIVYWEYTPSNPEHYEDMFKKYELLDQKVNFMGAVGTYYGFLPAHCLAYNNSKVALKACINHNVETVITSIWGDDGNETNAFLANYLLAVYSEYRFKGLDCTDEDIKRTAEYLTKIPIEDAVSMCSLTYTTDATPEKYACGKRLFYTDVLYDLAIDVADVPEAIEKLSKYRDDMKRCKERKDANFETYHYAHLVYDICVKKAGLAKDLRANYKAGDRKYLAMVKDVMLPELKDLYAELSKVHKKQWYETYKPFGYEVMSFRYGGILARLDVAIETIADYLSGKADSIPELEEELLKNELGYMQPSSCLVTPTFNLY